MRTLQDVHMKEQKKYNLLGPCGIRYTAINTGSWRTERPKADFVKCIKCRKCEEYCPTNVITIYKDKEECVEINLDYCKGCGICANECPTGCLSMIPERGDNDEL